MSGALAVALYVAAMLQAGGGHPSPVEMAASLAAAVPAAWIDARLAARPGEVEGAGRVDDPLRPLMEAATALGSGPGLAAVVAVAALIDPGAALQAATAGAGAGVVTLVHKVVLGRARPLAGAGPYTLVGPLSPDDEYQSLPSGHASGAAAVLGALGRVFPSAAPALEAAGILVGLSRVYLKRHWPSDVKGGRALGNWWAEAAAGP